MENKYLKIIELNGSRFKINTEEIRLLKILRGGSFNALPFFLLSRIFIYKIFFFFNLIICNEIISRDTFTQSGTGVIFDIRSISREQSGIKCCK